MVRKAKSHGLFCIKLYSVLVMTFSAAIGSCGLCRGWRTDSGGNVGMATGLFQSGQNGAPEKPFTNNMNYNTIQGLMTVEGEGPFIREADFD